MPDFLIRPSAIDAALLERALAPLAGRPIADVVVRPRIVLNADIAARYPAFAATARRAGVPLLVDPQTPFLQDYQHLGDRWASLPFATSVVLTPSDLTRARLLDLAADTIGFQIRHGATRVLTPYFHIGRRDDGWLERQIGAYQATRAHMTTLGIKVPLTAVIDVNWPLLARATWADALDPLLTAAAASGCDEIALAGSKVDLGVHPEHRLADLLAAIRRSTRTANVLAWNQGIYGEACVAAGAAGYETGIGWHERTDTPTWMRSRRAAPPSEMGLQRPVYIDTLGRSIPKKTVEQLSHHRSIAPDLPCQAGGCCTSGTSGLLGDARMHTIAARVRGLRELSTTDRRFRWTHLRNRAELGTDLARRINVIAERDGFYRVNPAPYDALTAVANAAAQRRSHRAA